MNYLKSIRLLSVEKITFVYIFITSVIIVLIPSEGHSVSQLLLNRLLVSISIFAMVILNSLKNWELIRLARYLFIGWMLSFWYPETYEIARVLANKDYLVAGWEQWMFGCQPSLLFGQHFPQNWVSELFNMGYFSYYPIILISTLFFYFTDRKNYDRFFFIVMSSFFLYYLIYIAFPTAGPQYYFYAIHYNSTGVASFPAVGLYFNLHNVLYEPTGYFGFFRQLVENAQQLGERPIAAFPSSHVGISTLIMILLCHYRKRELFWIFLPFYLILVSATVYIEAHYVVDALAGFFTAFFMYYVSAKIYPFFSVRDHKLAN